jgi:hypothetical protein
MTAADEPMIANAGQKLGAKSESLTDNDSFDLETVNKKLIGQEDGMVCALSLRGWVSNINFLTSVAYCHVDRVSIGLPANF